MQDFVTDIPWKLYGTLEELQKPTARVGDSTVGLKILRIKTIHGAWTIILV